MAGLPDKDKLIRNFSRCLNWEEKYLYVIELGAQLPPLTEQQRQPDNLISGCQSQVWIAMSTSTEGRWFLPVIAMPPSSKARLPWCLFCIRV